MRNRSLSLACAMALVSAASNPAGAATQQVPISTRHKATLRIDGLVFRDLNDNGQLDIYEDWRRTPEARAADLVQRMTVEEKAGTLLHGTMPPQGGLTAMTMTARYDLPAAAQLIQGRHITSAITREVADAETLANDNNQLQEYAEQTRLGIPLTLSSDPRNHFQSTAGASVQAYGFSQWPEALGFAALGDPQVVKNFADIARREYRAVGISMTLSPMADLATEPRWPRINGTFGEDAALSEKLVNAYVEGFQHGSRGVAADGVAAVVKHWVGYGAAREGLDSHNYYGRYSALTAAHYMEHVRPFLGAFEVNVAGVMPTYSILGSMMIEGRPIEQVGAAFNSWLITDQLRDRFGFKGIVVTDWAVANDCDAVCRNGFPAGEKLTMKNFSTAWGVEDMPQAQRFAKALNAGADQFGGVDDPSQLIAAMRSGLVSEARIDESVKKIMVLKFEQGLFENPYVDAKAAVSVVGAKSFKAAAHKAQAQSLVLLQDQKKLLPLKSLANKKVFLHGVSNEVAKQFGFEVVASPAAAEMAVVRMQAPYQVLHPTYPFGSRQHEGDLSFKDGNTDYEALKAVAAAHIPAIVSVYLDRPAILTNVRDKAGVLFADFGVDDTALFEVLTGKEKALGRLPLELPSSMTAVEAQQSDVPHDSANPLYPIFYRAKD